jgi:hypothetical protein
MYMIVSLIRDKDIKVRNEFLLSCSVFSDLFVLPMKYVVGATVEERASRKVPNINF